ncbi:uncharacterized protein VICG_00674 [Vittaforma corneae ATCC 50505]|uniref:Uncharacterized protein n=1 Tax=Vittaforma corneae (strain ATCC 50505) TaxID=993615 RepID=L2GNS8_VITCO|nr:uncharacterized protein VICG_00674 [Vittaforma corneae ATCC 50505]ELA42274.1 hypothetical protein VICG_00674 [Vittaforma corneae ATCC 50505]
MLASLLFTLLESVQSKCNEPCDCDSSFTSCSTEVCEQDCLKACYTKFDGDCKKYKSIIDVRPFICFDDCCPSLKDCCKPYLEFANIAEFVAKIPNAKKLKKMYIKNDVKGLIKFASQCDGCENYDALNAFYYNADSHSGIYSLKFDSNFILFFLQRFYYYLDLIVDSSTIKISHTALMCAKTNKCYDLLCPPCTYTDLTFGSESNALKLFNSILGNTAIHDIVIIFIRILLYQIHITVSRCAEQNNKLGGFSTYSLYAELLQQYLVKTKDLNVANTLYVENFGSSQVNFFYIWFPFENNTATGIVGAANLLNVPSATYTNSETFRFLNSDY